MVTTAHAYGAPLTSAEFNSRLTQLDAAIAAVVMTGSGVSTTLTVQATAGSSGPFSVASTAGLVVGDFVYFGNGATYEPRIIATVPSGTTFTTTVALSNTYVIGKPVSKSSIEIVEARGGLLSLNQRMLTFGRPGWIDARLYGWLGDGSDDSVAVAATLAAAIAVNGTAFIPAPSTYSGLSSTINLLPSSGASFKVNLVSETPIPFRWTGAGDTPVFHTKGWKNSEIHGWGVRTSVPGVVVWELDADATYTSSSHLTFSNNVNSFEGGGNCIGYRAGISGGNYDFSSYAWDTCLALGANAADGDIGWQNLSQNGLVWHWENCSALTLHTPFTNALARTKLSSAVTAGDTTLPVTSTANYPHTGKVVIDTERISYTGITSTSFTGCTRGVDGTTAASHVINKTVTQYALATTGGASMTFTGMSTSHTTVNFVFEAAGVYVIDGGRFESNQRFMTAGGSGGGTYPVSVVVNGAEVSTPVQPSDGVIYKLNAGVLLHVTGGWYHGSDHAANMVDATGAGAGAWGSVTFESLSVRSAVTNVISLPASAQWQKEYNHALRLSAELTPVAWFT